MISEKDIQELLDITAYFAGKADQIQGPGGNTSLKNDDGIMLIKASGFRFEELDYDNGVSAVNSKIISDYFHLVEPRNKAQEEKNMLELISANILKKNNGEPFPRPSMETGFHAVLGKFVVHTHSVWSNLINCAENRLELLEKLQDLLPYKISQLPFITPGFGLSYLVCESIKSTLNENNTPIDIFFLGNHGIIAHAETAEKTIKMLEEVDQCIRNLFGIQTAYPSTSIHAIGHDKWSPDSDYVISQIKNFNAKSTFFEQVLFPDQTVFFKEQISDTQTLINKINISESEVFYSCNAREATSIHETMTAYLFLLHQFQELNIKPHYILQSELDYINNMDMEKYRKKLMNL